MDQRLYHTGQFARKASVSIRTLRYYDKVGLLSPSHYTEAGYRLYSDENFGRLQQILALKFLGFSLEEIKLCLQFGPTLLQETLPLQKTMMQQKRNQLETVIQALEETEELLLADQNNWESIIKVIQVIQMQQSLHDWRKNYFTEEQLQKIEQLSKASYSEEDRKRLEEWGKNFTEENQKVASQRWDAVIAGIKGLVAGGKDPASAEAQALVKQQQDLINEFTKGDPGIAQGLQNFYKRLGEMPEQERPIPMPWNEEECDFLAKATEIYRQNKS